MNDYKSNSHKSREQRKAPPPDKKVEKVVKGTVKRKKKGEIQKFADVFISEDVGNLKTYILFDVLIPSIKQAIKDIVTNGIDMLLYDGSSRTRNKTPSSRVSYRDYYGNDRGGYASVNRRSSIDYNYDNIVLDNRGEAEGVLSNMDELIYTYGLASVADLYDLVGVTGDYTANKYGWTDIRNAQVVRVRDGYLIKLPKALPLN